jgi:7,8-dihydropterin-6-yl-methyl-4-(beta-D-ribofuranosyl)aminobenzene 5'-phosphate synthase
MTEITILYDNHALEGLQPGWGFAAAVQTATATLLFDCGADRLVLSHNAGVLGVDLERTDAVVLSHDHCDHTGGLSAVFHNGLSLWVPKSFARRFSFPTRRGIAVRAVGGPVEIAPGIRSLGQLGRRIPEQSLLVETVDGPVLITGCAHPGILQIVERAASVAGVPPHLLIGGLHLLHLPPERLAPVAAGLLDLGVDRIAACHCTGGPATRILRDAFGGRSLDAAAGTRISLR